MRNRTTSVRWFSLPKRIDSKRIFSCISLLTLTLSVVNCNSGGAGQTSSPDFNLGMSSNSVSVAPGGASQPVTLSATGLNGFHGSVTVAVSGLPSGVTVSPASPFNISALGNQAITFMASSSAATGSATITFQGSSGSLNHSTSLTLQITISPNFNLTISPSSISVSPGSTSQAVTLSATGLNGFQGSV